QLIDRLDHVYRYPNRPRLVRNRPRDRLANPPGGIRGKLVTTPPFKLIDCLHQTDVAFLDQIEELQTAICIFLRDRYDQPQVRLNQFAFGLTRLLLTDDDRLKRTLDFDWADIIVQFDL